MSVGTTTYPMLVTFGGLTSLLSREPVLSHVVEDALTRRTPTLDLQVAAWAGLSTVPDVCQYYS